MIKCNDWPIGVCTWSLQNDFDKLNILRDDTGLSHLHLAVSPALEENGREYLARIEKENWEISATMIDFAQEDYTTMQAIKATGGIVPDECWEKNRQKVFDAINVTVGLGVEDLSLHFGFLDLEDFAQAKKLYDRAKLLGDRAGEKGIRILMETGQETIAELDEFLKELNHPAFGVNFDPANIILYDKGNPVEAVGTLSAWIKHVHIKDGIRTQTPGTWGQEVSWGSGQVGSNEFLNALQEINFAGALAIEREAGDDRLGDIKIAVERLT